MVFHCSHAYSDHSHILLKTKGKARVRLGERPFRFEAAWLTHARFKEFAANNWPKEGQLTERLEIFGRSLKQWNKSVFGHIIWRKKRLRARLDGVQRRPAIHPTTAMLKLEQQLKFMLGETLMHGEIMWQQKSRVQWLQAGDRNTKFFHLSTVIRRRRNKAEALRTPDGSWVFDQRSLKDMVADYFRTLYATDPASGGTFITGKFPLLTSSMYLQLLHRYTSEEIYSAMKDMGPTKAPGPDGFNAAFFQQTWGVVGPSLTTTTMRILEGQEFHASMAEALMV